MRRRARLILGIGLAAAVGAAAGLIAFRVSIAETLIAAVLRANGVPAPRLSVVELGWAGGRIDELRLGLADEITVRSLRLGFSPSGLLAGRLDSAAADGVSLDLDLTGGGPPLGSLQPLLTGGGDNGGTAPPPVPLRLTDLRVAARTAVGTIRAAGGGSLDIAGDGRAVAEISLPEIAADGFTGSLSAAAEDPFGAPVWHLTVAADADAASPVWDAMGLPTPGAGHAKLTVSVEGNAAPGDPVAGVLEGTATGSAELALTDLSLPGRIAGLGGRVRLAIDTAGGSLRVKLPEDATLAAAQISAAFLQSLGIPADIAAQMEQGAAARLQPPGADVPVAVVSRDGEAIAVALDGMLTLSASQALELSLTLPADLRFGGGRTRGRLRTPADLRLTTLRYGSIAELLEPANIPVSEAEVTLGPESAVIDYRVALDAPALHLRLQQTGADAIDATVTPGRVTVSPGRAGIAGASIAIPAYGLAVDGLSASLDAEGGETRIGFRAAAVRPTGPDPLFAPLAVAGQATRTGTVWQGAAQGTGPGGMTLIDAGARHDQASGRGQAHVALEPLAFAPDGLQPGALSPALTALQAVRGNATGEADLTWSAQGVQGTAALAVHDFGFTAPQARVAGLDLDLRLDSLVPPASAPGQRLTVRRLEPGLPLDRLDIRFQIRPTAPPSLAVETGEVFFGSGRLALSDLVVDPAATRQHVDLRIEDLSVAELFALLNIDGLSGDGRLSGVIPMTFADGTVVIQDGRLAAGAPGIVRFRSEQAAQILAGQGESLDLVLRALEDFHYDELTVELEKSADDVGRLELGLLGKNPAVLEGYPFRFNISIEANTGKLVTALTTIYQVPNDFLRRAWTSGR